MKNSNHSLAKALAALAVGALLHPWGGFFSGALPEAYHQVIIAFMAGEFIFIGAGELLSEAHQKYNFGVVLSVILGAAGTAALEWLLKGFH